MALAECTADAESFLKSQMVHDPTLERLQLSEVDDILGLPQVCGGRRRLATGESALQWHSSRNWIISILETAIAAWVNGSCIPYRRYVRSEEGQIRELARMFG